VTEHRHAGSQQFAHLRRAEIGQADAVDLAFAVQLLQLQRDIDVTRHAVIPPVELHQVEALLAESSQ
jgi:hypothetical protein